MCPQDEVWIEVRWGIEVSRWGAKRVAGGLGVCPSRAGGRSSEASPALGKDGRGRRGPKERQQSVDSEALP